VPAHYALADLVVSYAEHDGFPVSFFEAALCQRPVLTSRLPAYEGALGDAFVRVPPADPVALAEALRQCLLEPAEQTRQRVEHAYAVAREMGDQRKCVQVMMRIFGELTRE
jgi:glycosyltransferase involved in cell wall biosynthesis